MYNLQYIYLQYLRYLWHSNPNCMLRVGLYNLQYIFLNIQYLRFLTHSNPCNNWTLNAGLYNAHCIIYYIYLNIQYLSYLLHPNPSNNWILCFTATARKLHWTLCSNAINSAIYQNPVFRPMHLMQKQQQWTNATRKLQYRRI